jgi:hypothetical protein
MKALSRSSVEEPLLEPPETVDFGSVWVSGLMLISPRGNVAQLNQMQGVSFST